MRLTERTATDLRAGNESRCRRIIDRSEVLRVDDLDWSSVADVEVAPGVIDALVYMRDVEGFTSSYVAGIGAHPTTLGDPIIASFLETWTVEEEAHAQALSRFLDVYARERGVEIPGAQPAPGRLVPLRERAVMHLGGPVGSLVAAAHMAWGAANELLTMNGYRMLAEQGQHPMLAQLLRRIAAQEARHYSFYLLQAEWRLADSRLARSVLPRVLNGSWTPVGVGEGYKTNAEFQHVVAVLHASPGADQIIDRMDRRFSALPGFSGLRIFRRAADPRS